MSPTLVEALKALDTEKETQVMKAILYLNSKKRPWWARGFKSSYPLVTAEARGKA